MVWICSYRTLGNIPYKKLATYKGKDGWLIVDGWDCECVTHWLEEKEITNELFELINK